jgi:hypothetical protein
MSESYRRCTWAREILLVFNIQWNGGKWAYAPATNTPDTIFMNDINNVWKAVRHIQPHQAKEILGIWMSPNGSTKTQCNKMLEKAILWVKQMRTGAIRKEETWLALQSTIWRTFSYPLNATNLTKIQCNSIMSPILNYALPAMGVCRNFPRVLVF